MKMIVETGLIAANLVLIGVGLAKASQKEDKKKDTKDGKRDDKKENDSDDASDILMVM
jgi:hypothetical protein